MAINTMIIDESTLQNIIEEELSKNEVNSLIASKIDDTLSSRDFKKKVKELAADVVSEVYKLLWQRNSFWKSAASNV